MTPWKDYAEHKYGKPKNPRHKKPIGSAEFVGFATLIALGMALGFVFGYGLLYT